MSQPRRASNRHGAIHLIGSVQLLGTAVLAAGASGVRRGLRSEKMFSILFYYLLSEADEVEGWEGGGKSVVIFKQLKVGRVP